MRQAARTRQPKSLSRPQSPSFLGHVVGYKYAEWLRDENAKIPDQLSRALLASQLVLAPFNFNRGLTFEQTSCSAQY